MSPEQIFLTVNGKRMSLAKLIENPSAATDVWVDNCAGLTQLPDLPAATDVWVDNCAGLTDYIDGGENPRGYKVFGTKIRGQWRIMAGCRNFSPEDARKHWGSGARKHAGCLAVAEKVIAEINRREAAQQ